MKSSILDINKIRKSDAVIICQGAHKKIIQSVLDFDYLSGKEEPSIKAIISQGRKNERFFYGSKEILIPIYDTIESVPDNLKSKTTYFLNISSGRRAKNTTFGAIKSLPNLIGASIFAENVPETHAVELIKEANDKGVWITGPSSVGLVMPGVIKLGAIGGIDHKQITNAKLLGSGKAAVLSSSGGMTNEMINIIAKANIGVSFSLSFGGDRFPILSPEDAFLAAENDKSTEIIVYFGELGGDDEYRLVELLESGKVKKPVVAYIAGSVAELFDEAPQFGHAKAIAKSVDETAKAKRNALKKAGAICPNTFEEFQQKLEKLAKRYLIEDSTNNRVIDNNRRSNMLITSISSTSDTGEYKVAGHTLTEYTKTSYGYTVSSLLLGRAPKSKLLPEVVETILKLLVDHGPEVSGAVNTIITARAGRDLPSALSAGLLTIGPRFGGAINEAARTWLRGVNEEISANSLVEEFAKSGVRIQGIGHKKYRVDNPDPRIEALLKVCNQKGAHLKFAKEVEQITTAKSGNLILNIDGVIAAVLLDILKENEGMSSAELDELIDIGFFNALFIIARSVGFTAHYLDQKRIDEGLFRII